MPFAAQMENYVKKAALKVLDNTFSGGNNTSGGGTETGEKRLIYSGLGGFYQGNAGNVIDGNDSTFAWFNASVTANGYIGLDLGAAYKLGKVRILQGRTQTDGDISHRVSWSIPWIMKTGHRLMVLMEQTRSTWI